MKKEELKNSAQTYYYFAAQDLAAARILVASNEIDIQVIMFHLQQAVEKLLKSVLSYHHIELSRTHDIERLINICKENEINLPDYIEHFVDLNMFAVEGRYAIIHDDICDAENFLREIEKLHWCSARSRCRLMILNQETNGPGNPSNQGAKKRFSAPRFPMITHDFQRQRL